ncbi:DUF6161 domain-containing protein [Ectopseudomonas mendocina]|uniref:DUF6161 domain-containing protein n=1 Tax=Ectopseudomonas mendocina TaxID=300 RepID=A0A2R3QVK9_ECTME|nr:DUF6161 domain-containing protein [Pseudomonas mendocina]AVO55750.1 hypothetical protein C7A17_24355 [Pseudomonas mendocina]
MFIELIDARGEVKKFASQKSFKMFARKEVKFWQDIQEKYPPRNDYRGYGGKHCGQSLTEILQSAKQIEILFQKLAGKRAYENTPELLNLKEGIRSRWLLSSSEFARKWLKLYETEQTYGDDFYYTSIEKSSTPGVFAANELTIRKILPESIETTLNLTREHIQELSNSIDEVNSLKERIFKSAEKQRTQLDNQLHRQNTLWKESLSHLEATYQEHLRLKGPANYWEEKSRTHWVRGTIFFVLLFALLISSIVGFGIFFSIWLAGERTPVSLSHIEGLLIFVAMISTLAFLSRVLSRVAFSEFHLQRDAEERLQLTHLYLSLSKETSLEDDARVIILQSLFSRAETGLLVNESGPTMPGIVDLLSAIKKSS